MINHFKFYKIYSAVMAHFNAAGTYDFFKYNGEINRKESSFFVRKDKYLFQKIADKCENEEMAIGFCISNIVAENTYIRNFNMEEYKKWISYRDGLSYKFKEEFDIYLKEKKGRNLLECLPNLLLQKIISFEFMILLNYIMDGYVFKELDKKENFLWEEMKDLIILYYPFIIKLWKIDQNTKKELKKIILNNT